MKIFHYLKIASINFIIFFLLYILLEIFSGTLLFKKKLNCNYLLCDQKYTFKNELYEPYNDIKYSRDKYGFRGRKKNLENIDILVLGGSTTDERYLNLDDTWVERLEEKINKKFSKEMDIVNAGIDGQSSVGHIWNFNNWFAKLDNIKPKYIIIYFGLNERDHKSRYDLEYQEFNFIDKIFILIKNNQGFTYNLYRHFDLIINKNEYKKIGHVKRNSNYKKVNYEKLPLDQNDKILSNKIYGNLKKLNDLVLDMNSIPIFITQRTLRWKKIDEQLFSLPGQNYYKDEKLRAETIMKFCEQNDLNCIDIFNTIDLKENDSYDLIHLNPTGAEKLSEEIYKKIINIIF